MKIFFRTFYTLLFLSAISFTSYSQNIQDTIYIASWNVENLFDTIDDPEKKDEEFLPESKKEWTNEKVDLKLENLSKVISYMNDGKGPSILGMEEVEHKHLLDTLLTRYFNKRNYEIAYFESLDFRGIDNGLIYDADVFSLSGKEAIEVILESGYPTRYILYTKLEHKNGQFIHCFVNHWPSRRGGEEKSRKNRVKAASVLKIKIDEILTEDENSFIVVMGDFNDEPDNISIVDELKVSSFNCNDSLENDNDELYNLSSILFEEGEGTYLYRGDWNMLDQIIVSKEMLNKNSFQYICNSFEIVKAVFSITKSGKYKGASRPTFGGSKYLAGYSDHFPVGSKFIVHYSN